MKDPITAAVEASNLWWEKQGKFALEMYALKTSQQIALFAFGAGFAAGIQYKAKLRNKANRVIKDES